MICKLVKVLYIRQSGVESLHAIHFSFASALFKLLICKGHEVFGLLLKSVLCDPESLCEFPPKSVQLKKPFSIQPWIASDDNVGNLLMVCCLII